MNSSARVPLWASLTVILFIGYFALPSMAQVLIVNQDVDHYTSIPLRDMPTAAGNAGAAMQEAEPARRIPLQAGLKAGEPDAALQTVKLPISEALAPIVGPSFDGLGQGVAGFTIAGAPPDTNGAVGLTQYVQWINTSIAVFDKATGALVSGPTPGNALFAALGGLCQADNDGDPVVNYDRINNRWVLSQFAVNGANGTTTKFLHCVAVSQTSDATGSYNIYAFQYSNFDDYPKMGVWPDAYYVTFNMFTPTTFAGADVCAYQSSTMLLGQPALQICFQQGNTVGGVLPSDFDGTILPPAGSPNYMMQIDTTTSLDLFKFHADFVTPANSTFTGPTIIPITSFSPLCGGGVCVPQLGTTQQLDSLADRLMFRLAYRNFGGHESLVVNHSVALAQGGGIRWYEIQSPGTTPTLTQQSTFAPDTNFRWMGSIAMDKAGDMAMGYSVSGSTLNPSIAITGRIPTDPANTMETETTILSGTGSQTSPTRNLSRWGDYSAMQIDPVDDCTFWYTTEYLKANGVFNWSTRIANFKFRSCAQGLRFVPATPCRVADTRNAPGPFGGPFVAANSTRSIAITASACNIPVTAQAYSLNMTVVPHGPLGFLTVFPCGQTKPLASTLNSQDGRVKAAASIVPAGAGGAVCNFVTNDTDLVIDIDGYFVPDTTVTALSFFPMTPCRLVDTRLASGPLGGPSLASNTRRDLPLLTSPCNIPPAAQAYSLNFTSVPKTNLGFLTVWPAGQTQPLVSTLNAPTGATTANAAIVPAGTAGAISVFATDNSDLVIDINGYFAPPGPGGLSLFNLSPCRILDTRNAGPTGFNGAINVNVGAGFCGAPPTAQSYVFNATVVPPGSLGFLTLWPQGATQPLVSTLNAGDATITSNMAIVPTSNGSISAFGSQSTQLILDVFGYFAP